MKAQEIEINYNPPEGGICPEKLDGCRCRSDSESEQLISRQNKVFNCPKWIINLLLLDGIIIPVDGELFAGRENFQNMGVVRKKIPIDEEWMNIKYYLYDCLHPDVKDKPFNKRYSYLKKCVSRIKLNWNQFVKNNSKFK